MAKVRQNSSTKADEEMTSAELSVDQF